jgi:hypothetical protein
MAFALPSFETSFINEFARTYIDEISFSGRLLGNMAELGIGLSDVIRVLQEGSVSEATKDDIDGAHWTVEGETTEDATLSVRIQVWGTTYRVRVLDVSVN